MSSFITYYFYKHKTYIRRGTSTIEADAASQKRMIMESKGITFEERAIQNEKLSFKYLNNLAVKTLGIKKVDDDFLKTCGLISSDNKFNNAGLLFSEDNNFCGIDTVKYNEATEKFTFCKNFSKCSILEQVEKVLGVFDDVYSYEKIVGAKREKFYDVPLKAFREAMVNAVIHRDWEIKSNIKVTFFDDRVEVLSPGVLPKDISKNEFLNGFVSVPRNYTICSLFRRLGYIERMGYGISLIKKAYRQHPVKPRFEISENFINVVLPVVGYNLELSDHETLILQTLKYSKPLSSSQISQLTKISRTKVVALCNSLVSQSLLQKTGTGRATKYHL